MGTGNLRAYLKNDVTREQVLAVLPKARVCKDPLQGLYIDLGVELNPKVLDHKKTGHLIAYLFYTEPSTLNRRFGGYSLNGAVLNYGPTRPPSPAFGSIWLISPAGEDSIKTMAKLYRQFAEGSAKLRDQLPESGVTLLIRALTKFKQSVNRRLSAL